MKFKPNKHLFENSIIRPVCCTCVYLFNMYRDCQPQETICSSSLWSVHQNKHFTFHFTRLEHSGGDGKGGGLDSSQSKQKVFDWLRSLEASLFGPSLHSAPACELSPVPPKRGAVPRVELAAALLGTSHQRLWSVRCCFIFFLRASSPAQPSRVEPLERSLLSWNSIRGAEDEK